MPRVRRWHVEMLQGKSDWYAVERGVERASDPSALELAVHLMIRRTSTKSERPASLQAMVCEMEDILLKSGMASGEGHEGCLTVFRPYGHGSEGHSLNNAKEKGQHSNAFQNEKRQRVLRRESNLRYDIFREGFMYTTCAHCS